MKKFFALLLIAIFACQVVGEGIKFRNLIFDDQFDNIVNDAIRWLRRNNYLEEITTLLHSGNKAGAMNVCCHYFKDKICEGIMKKI